MTLNADNENETETEKEASGSTNKAMPSTSGTPSCQRQMKLTVEGQIRLPNSEEENDEMGSETEIGPSKVQNKKGKGKGKGKRNQKKNASQNKGKLRSQSGKE